MQGKKLYFFNLKWSHYPQWKQALISLPPVLLVYIPIWFLESKWWLLPGLIMYGLFFIYFLWLRTLKNRLDWRKGAHVILKIKGKKLELDLKLLSEVWIESEELHICRINRVDTFPVAHLRKEDVEKLVEVLKEYEPQAA